MDAREQLIRAYAHATLRPSSGGDHDIGARGTHTPVRRKSRGKFTDPMHCKQSKGKAVNTNSIIMNSMIAGKIISAAEGEHPHTASFSRIHYSDTTMRRDRAVIGSYLTRRVLERQSLKSGILGASQAINYYASGGDQFDGECDKKVLDFIDSLIYGMHRSCLTRVGLLVKKLTYPEK